MVRLLTRIVLLFLPSLALATPSPEHAARFERSERVTYKWVECWCTFTDADGKEFERKEPVLVVDYREMPKGER